MKHFFYQMLVITAISATAVAQSITLKAGATMSTIFQKDNDEVYKDNKLKPGFLVGANVDFPINDLFSFETGLLLTSKGYKFSDKETFLGITTEYVGKANLLYLDIPITPKVSFGSGSTSFYALLGPYVGLGLMGNYKSEVTINGEKDSESDKVEWGSKDGDFKRLDFGLLAGGGVQFNAIQIGVAYGFGLANISPYNDGGYRENNRVLSLTAGYSLGDKKSKGNRRR